LNELFIDKIYHLTFVYILQGNLKSERAIQMCLHYKFRCHQQENKTALLHKRLITHSSEQANRIIPFNLTDIGEGINEVSIKEWLVCGTCLFYQCNTILSHLP
jgi:hypothetical protein